GLIGKLVVVVPAHSQVQSEVLEDFPVILHKRSIVVIAQADLIVVGCEATLGIEKINPGVDGAKRFKIRDGGKELVEEVAGLGAVDVSTLKIPAEFQVMAADLLCEICPQRYVLLLEQ